ncbi:MAG: flagellar biosynthesis anti-sigma factor FlgM [Thermodesulfobacteriota bacterium]
MKITDAMPVKPGAKIGAGKEIRREGEVRPAGGVLTGDRVELSSDSREVREAQRVLQEVPEVRTELVQALKAKIERNEYHVDAGDIADKMLGSLLGDLGIPKG